jgi:hypothetical protein
MAFHASVAISALLLRMEGHSGVAELMICRLSMFSMQVQSLLWGQGVGILPVGHVEISLTCTTNHV